MTIRNGKVVFTTSIQPDVLEDFRLLCWDRDYKINAILENLMVEYLEEAK